MSNRRVVAWYLVRDAECLTDVRKRLILLAFVSYEAVRLWWRGGSNGVVRQAVSVQIPPLPPDLIIAGSLPAKGPGCLSTGIHSGSPAAWRRARAGAILRQMGQAARRDHPLVNRRGFDILTTL